jgi:hypothetical protein
MKAITKIASEPFVAGSLQNMHIVEHTAGHIALKQLIQNDKERIHSGKSGRLTVLVTINNAKLYTIMTFMKS